MQYRNLSRTLPLAALLVAALAPLQSRGDAGAADHASSPLTELERVLAEPVYGSGRAVGASKHEQDLALTPASVVVRTGGEIRVQGYRTLAEVLDSMPGIHVQYDRAYSYVGVRGINRPGDFTSRLLVLVDGVRVNDPLYESASLGREFPVDIGLIDRVEYIPGPGSALYGSSAALGVVNVITRNPSQRPGLTVSAEAGTGASRKLAATWGGEVGSARMLVGLAVDERPGGTLHFPEYDTAGNRGIVKGQDGERASSLFLKSRWTDWVLTAAASERTKDIPTASYAAVFGASNRWIDRNALLNLSFDRSLDERQELHARLGAQHYEFQSRATFGSVDERLDGFETDIGDALSGELRYTWLGWTGHRLMAGYEFQRNLHLSINLTEQVPGSAATTLTDVELSSTRQAVFASDEWQLAPSVLLTTGLRVDRRLDGNTTVTPRVAVVWTPVPDWTVKWMQGSAFREPNAYERYYTYGSQKTNPNLKVESLDSRELALLWRPAPAWTLEASAYSFRVHDLLELMTDTDGLDQFSNRGSAKSHGVELSATFVSPGGSQWRGSVSRQRATDGSTGQVLSGAPATLAKLMWTVPGPWAGSRLGLNGEHVSSRMTIAGARLGSYTRANLHLSYNPPAEPWSLAFGVYNLGGERHADPVGPEHLQDSIRQDGREARLQFSWTY